MHTECDVLVVGAGPAGSAAAITLAQGGQRVHLVDRSMFPREKACGDGLSPRALVKLHQWEVWGQLAPHAATVTRLRTLDLRSGCTVVGDLPSRVRGWPEIAAVVPRDRLDDVLRLHAMALGASWQGGVVVTSARQMSDGAYEVVGRRASASWRCRCRGVVIADGASGALSRIFRGATDATLEGVAIRQYWRVPGVADALTICVPLEGPEGTRAGYGWIFPLPEDIANVGVGVYRNHDAGSIRGTFARFLERMRSLDPIWRRAHPAGAPRGELLRCGLDATQSMRDGIVLAGDAVGATNPYTGEGIAQALETGELSGQAMGRYLRGDEDVPRKHAGRLRAAFPETTRSIRHLPWLIERGERFACEFWGVTTGSASAISKAARRMTLDEGLADAPVVAGEVEATWCRVYAAFADTPLLGQFLEAFGNETARGAGDALTAYWERIGSSAQDGKGRECVADLLALSILIVLLIDGTILRRHDEATIGAPEWVTNAVTLGVADLVFTQYLTFCSRVAAVVAVGCTESLRAALAEMQLTDDHGAAVERVIKRLVDRACDVAREVLPRAA